MAIRASLCPLILSLAVFGGGCSGGGGGGGSSAPTPPPQPAYVNGTTTGQYTNNDIGFYLGASTNPSVVVASTPSPKLVFDIGNGFTTAKTVNFRVLQDGLPFHSGSISDLPGLSFLAFEVAITAGAGTHVYRIELDHTSAISETNENNNFVEFVVTVAASG